MLKKKSAQVSHTKYGKYSISGVTLKTKPLQRGHAFRYFTEVPKGNGTRE